MIGVSSSAIVVVDTLKEVAVNPENEISKFEKKKIDENAIYVSLLYTF